MEELVSAADALRTFAGRRVLVTGHTGFKGSWLCLWLTRLGAEVTGFSDAVPSNPSHFDALQIVMDDRRGDVADEAAVAAAFEASRPEIVFHLAAQPLVRRAYADPVGTYRTNVLGSLVVMEAARRAGVGAFVSATTDKVYRNDESGRPYSETDELGGSDPYSASKSCVELMTRSYQESFLRDGAMLLATVRAGNVIGGGDWAEDRLVPDLVRAAFSGEPAMIRNPQSTRPWQHVLDVLAGYLEIGARLLRRDRDAVGAWNFGPSSTAGISVADIIAAVQSRLPGLAIDYQPEAGGRHESGLLQLDSGKARSRLRWRPLWEDAMLERTLEWYGAFADGRVVSVGQLADYENQLVSSDR
ncbi:CDP-glucose 4,6-dehydratase [Sphingomonas sp. F9_3S_D5_B_2]